MAQVPSQYAEPIIYYRYNEVWKESLTFEQNWLVFMNDKELVLVKKKKKKSQ
jgi:hypothetical protein